MSKLFLQCICGNIVHYSSRHHNYFTAWLYVSKSDREFKENAGHPDLRNRGKPRTDLASWSRRKRVRREDDTEQGGDGDETVMIVSPTAKANAEVHLSWGAEAALRTLRGLQQEGEVTEAAFQWFCD